MNPSYNQTFGPQGPQGVISSGGDIVLSAQEPEGRGRKKIWGIVAAVVVMLVVAVGVWGFFELSTRNAKIQIVDIAKTIVDNEQAIVNMDTMIVDISEGMKLGDVLSEDSFKSFEKAVKKYKEVCEKVCDATIAGGSSVANDEKELIGKIKERVKYYDDALEIYSLFYDAFILYNNEAIAKLAGSENDKVIRLYKNIDGLDKKVVSAGEKIKANGCNDILYSEASLICRQSLDEFSGAVEEFYNSDLGTEIFVVSDYYENLIGGAKENQLHELIDKIRGVLDEQ